MTTLTLRYQRGHFFVVGPDTSIKFKSRREARDWCAEHHPGSPIKEIGADATKRASRAMPTEIEVSSNPTTPARLGVVFSSTPWVGASMHCGHAPRISR